MPGRSQHAENCSRELHEERQDLLFGCLGFVNAFLKTLGAAMTTALKFLGTFDFLVGHVNTPYEDVPHVYKRSCLDCLEARAEPFEKKRCEFSIPRSDLCFLSAWQSRPFRSQCLNTPVPSRLSALESRAGYNHIIKPKIPKGELFERSLARGRRRAYS